MVFLGIPTAAAGLWAYGHAQTVRYAGSVALLLLAAWMWFGDYTPSSLDSVNPLKGGIALVDPLAMALRGSSADKWFFYTVAYTTGVSLMAVRMAFRYRHNRYHLARTASVVFWQASFGFVVPMLLSKMGQKEHYFSYFWPLKPEYLLPFNVVDNYWDGGTVARAMFLWGVMMSLVGVPVLTYLYGKRWYCSWVCGCGALAETVGDPWRQLSDKSERAWRVERWSIHGVLALIVGITVFLWTNEALGRPWMDHGRASGLFWDWYGFFIVAGFAGIVGTGFYPVLGSRIWCRFGCPQAAVLGILQRFFSRFRITTNGGQCISCGNCSTYCEMGIDVRAYAQRGDNIVRASCVGCGVCAAVCPRGVLKLENGAMGDRFEGADDPLGEMLRSLGIRPRTGDPGDR
ncbi:MAG: 4Fe-4S binding protein [Alphaproteobacteria bacterium]|nr:4Fe-4S binding protein [Alphaproteobacteria bacterium]MCB9693416.1 4Fe-4S binding protein [Alphaproteobacteria bacterium]